MALAITLMLSSCAWLVGPGPRAESREGDFVLGIATPRLTWSSEAPIDVHATLAYVGPLATTAISASGSGPIAFGVEELEGTRQMEAGWNDDCAKHDIGRQSPIVSPYAKSGGWSDGDPNEAFYRAFFDDPEFRLPPGRWRVSAVANFLTEAGCQGSSIQLDASVILTVE